MKREFLSWINDLVGAWGRQLIGGLMRRFAQSAVGQRMLGWAMNLIPGVGGLGASAATAAAATSVMDISGLASVTAATTGTATGASFLASLTAFATNPFTIAAAGVILGGFFLNSLRRAGPISTALYQGITRTDPELEGRFRAVGPNGELLGSLHPNVVEYNRRRTGGSQAPRSTATSGPLPGRWGGLPAPRPLSTASFDRALQMPDVRPASGAMTAPSVRSAGDSTGATTSRTVNLYATIHALDGADVERVWREKLVPKLKLALRTGQDGVNSAVRDAALA
jgi:hypothetical protein